MVDIYNKYSLSHIHSDWAGLVRDSYRLIEPSFRAEAIDFATQIMAKAKHLIGVIIDQLSGEGYRFVNAHRVQQPPDPFIWNWAREYESEGIYLPISLMAWIAVVGPVDLRGSHPNWPKSGYVFEDMLPTNNVFYTDPLVVEFNKECLDYQKTERELSGRNKDGSTFEPFCISVSPDHIHKANVSGGRPYEMQVGSREVDSLLLNERHCTSFVSYIRTSLLWGGFAGLEYIKDFVQMEQKCFKHMLM